MKGERLLWKSLSLFKKNKPFVFFLNPFCLCGFDPGLCEGFSSVRECVLLDKKRGTAEEKCVKMVDLACPEYPYGDVRAWLRWSEQERNRRGHSHLVGDPTLAPMNVPHDLDAVVGIQVSVVNIVGTLFLGHGDSQASMVKSNATSIEALPLPFSTLKGRMSIGKRVPSGLRHPFLRHLHRVPRENSVMGMSATMTTSTRKWISLMGNRSYGIMDTMIKSIKSSFTVTGATVSDGLVMVQNVVASTSLPHPVNDDLLRRKVTYHRPVGGVRFSGKAMSHPDSGNTAVVVFAGSGSVMIMGANSADGVMKGFANLLPVIISCLAPPDDRSSVAGKDNVGIRIIVDEGWPHETKDMYVRTRDRRFKPSGSKKGGRAGSYRVYVRDPDNKEEWYELPHGDTTGVLYPIGCDPVSPKNAMFIARRDPVVERSIMSNYAVQTAVATAVLTTSAIPESTPQDITDGKKLAYERAMKEHFPTHPITRTIMRKEQERADLDRAATEEQERADAAAEAEVKRLEALSGSVGPPERRITREHHVEASASMFVDDDYFAKMEQLMDSDVDDEGDGDEGGITDDPMTHDFDPTATHDPTDTMFSLDGDSDMGVTLDSVAQHNAALRGLMKH